MSIKTVTVFGASGRQGQAQLRRLTACVYWARAASRNAGVIRSAGIEDLGGVAADFDDPVALRDAAENADALFFQPPQVERPDRIIAFAQNVAAAAKQAGVQCVVINSTMRAPDQACGQGMYDLALTIENVFVGAGLPVVVFRPTIFMDNWLSAFARPLLVKEHKYRYPHKPDLRYSPICLDDVAKFMVATLEDESLLGRRLRIAGPETLTPPQVAVLLSEAMGVKISYEYQSPIESGNYLYELFGAATGVDRETYVHYFNDFYTFNIDAAQQPLYFDVAPTLQLIPTELESFRDWAHRQDSTTIGNTVGSFSR